MGSRTIRMPYTQGIIYATSRRRSNKKNLPKWQHHGFSSYQEWFQMRNRIYNLIWKGRDGQN